MFLDFWDVRLEISVVSTHVNLNGLSVHVKNRNMEIGQYTGFDRLTSINQWGKCAGEKIAKHRQMMKFFHSHLTYNIFNYCMLRFFFGLVYIFHYPERNNLSNPHILTDIFKNYCFRGTRALININRSLCILLTSLGTFDISSERDSEI